MSAPPATVLLNPAARHGAGRRRWERIEPALRERFTPRLLDTSDPSWPSLLARELGAGTRAFIAAGGDGTVHALLNALQRARGAVPLGQLRFGAVGLGSSNDFHKPVRRTVAGVPVRLDLDQAVPRDVARARFAGPDGTDAERLFLVSASVGATARANAFFNQGDGLLRLLKRLSVPAAIAYAAVRTLLRHQHLPATLRVDGGGAQRIALSNLSVMKTPYLSGSFRYDTPIEPGDGLLAVNLCEGMSRGELLRTLARLLRGRFLGTPRTRAWRAPAVVIESPAPFDLELDGELYRTSRVELDLLPERLMVSP